MMIILIINFLAAYRYPTPSVHRGNSNLISLFTVNNTVALLIILANSPLMFYILFELSAIPIFFIIIGWGYQPEKIKAGYSMLMYTISLASPVVIALVLIKLHSGEWFLSLHFSPFERGTIKMSLSLILVLAFLVKLPLYSIHLWLPMAHVEAPVFGSIILAGILLKFGGIGLLIINTIIISWWIDTVLCVTAVFGLIIVSLVILQLTDLKMIIAYTRVAHMGFVPVALYIRQGLSVSRRVLIMLTHAFSSSGIFFISFLVYKISNSRRILVNKGLISSTPFLSFLWLIVILARLGTPPTINLLSEVLCISLVLKHFLVAAVPIAVSFVAARAVHFILFRNISQGIRSEGTIQPSPVNLNGAVIAFYHVALTLIAFPVLDILY